MNNNGLVTYKTSFLLSEFFYVDFHKRYISAVHSTLKEKHNFFFMQMKSKIFSQHFTIFAQKNDMDHIQIHFDDRKSILVRTNIYVNNCSTSIGSLYFLHVNYVLTYRRWKNGRYNKRKARVRLRSQTTT